MKLQDRLGHALLGMVMLVVAAAAFVLSLQPTIPRDAAWLVWALSACCLICGVVSLLRATMPD